MVADPTASFTTDCLSVCDGTKRGMAWANSAARRYARAWSPLISALDGDGGRVRWMPAHQSAVVSLDAELSRQKKTLSDGTMLTIANVRANAVVDKHAKAIAMQDIPPACDFELIRVEADRLRDVATWIGVATHAANNWPAPREEGDTGPVKLMRDSSAIRKPHVKRPSQAPLQAHSSSAGAAASSEEPLSSTGVLDAVPASTVAAICTDSGADRPSSKRTSTGNTTSASVLQARAAKRARLHATAQVSADQLRLQDWVEALPKRKPPPVPAQQRLQLLRARLASK